MKRNKVFFKKKIMFSKIVSVCNDMLLDHESLAQRSVLGTDSTTEQLVCVLNLALFCASWTVLLTVFSTNEPRSETAAVALAYCGALNVLAVHWMPCVMSRITTAACALTLVQIAVEATDTHAPTFVSIWSLLVYVFFVFLEWLMVTLQLPDAISSTEDEDTSNDKSQNSHNNNNNRFAGRSYSVSDILSYVSRDSSLALFTRAGVELLYVLTALQHDDDCGLLVLHGSSKSQEYLAIPFLWVFSAACASSLKLVATDMQHTTLNLPSVAIRNAMLVTHRSTYWPIPIARALMDLLTAWRYSRNLNSKSDR